MSTRKPEVLVGAHTSIAGGVHNALLMGKQIGATTIQLFTSNQRQWKGHPITPEAVETWNKTLAETGLHDIMSHDSYLINLGCPEKLNLEKSRQAFREEIGRCKQLNIKYLNFHPGAALQAPREACLDTIVESLLSYEDLVAGGQLRLLLETTAGQGSVVGWRFDELAYIIERVKNKIPIGVCIDTCHIYVSGYDIKTAEGCDLVLKEFDRIIGLEHLYAFHFNDSLKGLGSRVDRHEPLGNGTLGWDCFKFFMTDPRTSKMPKYLETPEGPEGWIVEIQKLKQFAESE